MKRTEYLKMAYFSIFSAEEKCHWRLEHKFSREVTNISSSFNNVPDIIYDIYSEVIYEMYPDPEEE